MKATDRIFFRLCADRDSNDGVCAKVRNRHCAGDGDELHPRRDRHVFRQHGQGGQLSENSSIAANRRTSTSKTLSA